MHPQAVCARSTDRQYVEPGQAPDRSENAGDRLQTGDYSAGGACLELNSDIKLPDRLEMFSRHHKEALPGGVETGKRIGVSF